MKPLEVRKYLFDIDRACDLISRFTAGKTFEDYVADPMLRSAVERQFEIVGEALNKAIYIDPDLEKSISGTRRIVAFRNRLIHGYASISDKVVWGVIESGLSDLHSDIAALLKDV